MVKRTRSRRVSKSRTRRQTRKVSRSRTRRQTRKVSKSRTRRQTRKVSKSRTRRQTRNVEQIGGIGFPCLGGRCRNSRDDDEGPLLEHEENPPFQGDPHNTSDSYQKETAVIEGIKRDIVGLEEEKEKLKAWLDLPEKRDADIPSVIKDIKKYKKQIRELKKKLKEEKANKHDDDDDDDEDDGDYHNKNSYKSEWSQDYYKPPQRGEFDLRKVNWAPPS